MNGTRWNIMIASTIEVMKGRKAIDEDEADANDDEDHSNRLYFMI